jgi:hypothetical protein
VTITGNSSGSSGGGVWAASSAPFSLSSSILAHNDGSNGDGIYGAASNDVVYTDVWDGSVLGTPFTAGVDGNIEADPLFVSWTTGAPWTSQDVALQSLAAGDPVDSPCVDAGDPSERDRDGTRADMGYFGGRASP